MKSTASSNFEQDELGNEVYFEDFRINNRRYTFSIRKKRGCEEHYLVLTEKKVVGKEKKYTHKIRIYSECAKSFLDRMTANLERVIQLNEGNNGKGENDVVTEGGTQEVPINLTD